MKPVIFDIKDDRLLSCPYTDFCSPLTTGKDDCTECKRYNDALREQAKEIK